MVNQQKSVIYKLKETYKQIKNSNISLDSLNRQKDQDIEDLRRAMISMELSSQVRKTISLLRNTVVIKINSREFLTDLGFYTNLLSMIVGDALARSQKLSIIIRY